MAEKTLKTRIVIKHDTSTNWNGATSFVPKLGELISYDDLNALKIGNGYTTVDKLPFINSISNASEIPSDYVHVQYIEGAGNVYLDTGITPTATDELTYSVMPLSYAKFPLLSTGYGSVAYYAIEIQIDSASPYKVKIRNFTSSFVTTDFSYNKRLDITLKRTSIKINDKSYASATENYIPSKSAILLWRRDQTASNCAIARIYGFGVTGKSKLIPVIRKSDSVCGMYDTIRKTFITGTGGSFTAGPVVNETSTDAGAGGGGGKYYLHRMIGSFGTDSAYLSGELVVINKSATPFVHASWDGTASTLNSTVVKNCVYVGGNVMCTGYITHTRVHGVNSTGGSVLAYTFGSESNEYANSTSVSIDWTSFENSNWTDYVQELT